METIPISKFKAECLALVQRVKQTGRPILLTRFGKPVAEVVPPRRPAITAGWLGGMRGSVEEGSDDLGPALDPRHWDALSK